MRIVGESPTDEQTVSGLLAFSPAAATNVDAAKKNNVLSPAEIMDILEALTSRHLACAGFDSGFSTRNNF
jgi:hypothetical protein